VTEREEWMAMEIAKLQQRVAELELCKQALLAFNTYWAGTESKNPKENKGMWMEFLNLKDKALKEK
jgi:hypothetical protein